MKRLSLATGIVLVLLTQSQTQGQSNALPKGFPIVYGKKNDGLPKKLKMRGVIDEVSPAWIHCGVLATAGTIKVKLTEHIKGYPHESVYLVLPCFSGDKAETEAKYLNKGLSAEVQKLYARGRPCYFDEGLLNRIDSQGAPFYCLRDWRNVFERSAQGTRR